MNPRKSFIASSFFLLAAAAFPALTARADLIRVHPEGGGDFTGIQAAIDAAEDGGIVEVAPGEYLIEEPLTFRGKQLLVTGTEGAERTTIRMSPEPLQPERASVVAFEAEGRSSILTGFTLTGGKGMKSGAKSKGGGVYCGPNITPTIQDCVIAGNEADLGGGIYATGGVLLRGCTIRENEARETGGGLHGVGLLATVDTCVFTANSATKGGGIFISEGTAQFAGCTVSENSASESGGGLFCTGWSCYPLIEGCTFSDNSSGAEGGGLFVDRSCYPRLNSCVITGNSARDGGGVVTRGSSYPYITGSIIAGNRAESGGGLLSLENSYPFLTSCRISGNSAASGGAIMSHGSSNPHLKNCLLAGNSADLGGAVLTRDSSYPYLMSCTVSGNSARNGGGLAVADGSYPVIVNSIVWGNTGGSFASGLTGSPRATFSCSERFTAGEKGNINRDPRFSRAGAWDDGGTPAERTDDRPIDGDYRLASTSPAIDAGARRVQVDGGSDLEAPGDDIEGMTRDCWRSVDMGAYEYCGASPPDNGPPFVFASRQIPGQRFEVGDSPALRASEGRLLIREPGGNILHLVDRAAENSPAEAPIDVMDPDVSFDGNRIVFSGFSSEDDAWRIYEVRADGTGLRRITKSDRVADLSRQGESAPQFERYDDLDPCYLPGGGICFVSTRYPESAPEGRFRATNLYIVGADGGDTPPRRITSERFGADTPTVDPSTGNIVYSRWWRTPEVRSGSGVVNPDIPHEGGGEPKEPAPPAVPPGSPGYGNTTDVPPPPSTLTDGIPPPSTYRSQVFQGVAEADFPGVNSWFLASIRPDGTGLAMFTGFHLDRVATQAYRPSFDDKGLALALFLTETPVIGRPGVFGLREYERGLTFPAALGGPQTFGPADAAVFRYSSAVRMPDGRILVSGTGPTGLEPDGSDLFIQEDADSAPVFFFGTKGAAEMDAVLLMPRKLPPKLAAPVRIALTDSVPRDREEAVKEGGTFVFACENVFANGGINEPLPNAPPIGRKLFIEFYMSPQGTSFLAADPPVLLERREIPASGRVEVELPAGVPLFEVLRRPDGTIPVGRDGQIFHVGGLNFGTAGARATCVGCHAGHSLMDVPADPALTNIAPSAAVTATSERSVPGATFRPALLVDRRTDVVRSEWAADSTDKAPAVRLRWSVPVRASEVVLHSPKRGVGPFGIRNQLLRNVIVNAYLDGKSTHSETIPKSLEESGTRLAFASGVEMDTLEVVITDATGLFEGGAGAALAEIEVIGEVIEGSVGGLLYLRADGNCDGNVNVIDVMNALDFLFRGGGPLCCPAASDVDDDQGVGISDSIFLLNHLFRGGPPPMAPYPECGAVMETDLGCDAGACP